MFAKSLKDVSINPRSNGDLSGGFNFYLDCFIRRKSQDQSHDVLKIAGRKVDPVELALLADVLKI